MSRSGRRLGLAAVLVSTALVAACTGAPGASAPAPIALTAPSAPSQRASPGPAATPSPAASRAPRPHVHLGTWRVGARPLPLRPDGFGSVLPTPPQLRVRRLPTRSTLPAPADRRFHASAAPISTTVRTRMGTSWQPGCPVPLDGLRYVTVSFWGFDRQPHTGELVVNARVAADVIAVFRTLFAARYPIEEMRLIDTADLVAAPTGDGNNTAAFVCRPARGQTSWSAHAYGLAIDVNPFVNPYSKGDLVLPELASAYLDRHWRRPGMIGPHDRVVRAFAAIGWTWGGTFSSVSDRMHFSATGR